MISDKLKLDSQHHGLFYGTVWSIERSVDQINIDKHKAQSAKLKAQNYSVKRKAKFFLF